MDRRREMPRSESLGYEAVGLNTHYRPPLNRLRTGEIKLPADTIAGVVLDSKESGSLVIVVMPGETWSDRVELAPGQEPHMLTEDRQFFAVSADDHGPAIGHEFEPDPDNPASCLTCGVEG
jgi:hypothetical protein